jgi:transposase-like protein
MSESYTVEATHEAGTMKISDICPRCESEISYIGYYSLLFRCPHCKGLLVVEVYGAD